MINNNEFKSFIKNVVTPSIKEFDGSDDAALKITNELATARLLAGEVDLATVDKLQIEFSKKIEHRHIQQMNPADIGPEMIRKKQPVGSKNRGGNDCWANVIVQLLANAPRLRRLIVESKECALIAPLIQNYYKAQLLNETTAKEVDSSILRHFVDGISSYHEQVDAFDGLHNILNKIGFGFNLRSTYLIPYEEGVISEEQEYNPNASKEPFLELNVFEDTLPFNQLLELSFSGLLEGGLTRLIKFESAPDDLIIHAKRYGKAKETEITAIPDPFELPPEYTHKVEKGLKYELTNCIIHTGTDNKGHYIILVKKSDGWYVINDSIATKIGDKAAGDLLKKGYIFHYSKVGAPISTKATKEIIEEDVVISGEPVRPSLPLPVVLSSATQSWWPTLYIHQATRSFFEFIHWAASPLRSCRFRKTSS